MNKNIVAVGIALCAAASLVVPFVPVTFAQSAPSAGATVVSPNAAELQKTIDGLKERLSQLQKQMQARTVPLPAAPVAITPRDAADLKAALSALGAVLQGAQSSLARGGQSRADAVAITGSLRKIVANLAAVNATITGQRALALAPSPAQSPVAQAPTKQDAMPVPAESRAEAPLAIPTPELSVARVPAAESAVALAESTVGQEGKGFSWLTIGAFLVVAAAGAWTLRAKLVPQTREESPAPLGIPSYMNEDSI